MKHVGVICEYNPFHGGHAHLLGCLREAETVICLMSGNFTQRGEAAILPAHERAAMALAAGADLVLELPFPFAAGSARYFATAGVDALDRLGADTLAFGSESADPDALRAAAETTLKEDFAKKVANGSRNKGDAAIFFEALGTDLPPNDILAVEYARAVRQRGERMALYPVLRVGAGFHDTDAEAAFPSATALRKKIQTGGEICDKLLPQTVKIWEDGVERYGIARTDRLGSAMLARLRTMLADRESIADCGGGLLERLIAAAIEAVDYESLCRLAATKKYTDGRIRRALLYLMAGVTYADLEARPVYLRLLGANERGRNFLAETRKTRTVSVVTKPADVTALGEAAARQRALAAIGDGLYTLCMEKPVSPAALAILPPLML